MSIDLYISAIESNLRRGNATEHTHRTALTALRGTIKLMTEIDAAIPQWPLA